MSDDESQLTSNRTRLQALYARGLISIVEYNALGRMYGFISPEKPERSTSVRQAATIAGYVMLVLGAAAQVIATRRPEMKGPLDAVLEMAAIVADSLQ